MTHPDAIAPFDPTGTLRRKREPAPAGTLHHRLRELATPGEHIDSDPALVWAARNLVANATGLPDDLRALVTLKTVDLLHAIDDGSTRHPITPDEARRIAASNVLGLHVSEAPDGERYLTTERLFATERRLADGVLRLLSTGDDPATPGELTAAIDEVDQTGVFRLNQGQRRAVERAARSPLALITGGPGTGKTTIAVSILRALVRLGYEPHEIALAAPTGKAAYRMRESIDDQLASIDDLPGADAALQRDLPEARTLHRLLGYSGRTRQFSRDADRPVDARVIICDETSMVDLELMLAMVDALATGTRLVLMGDARQLPAVASGAVFRDLIAALPHCVAELTESYRQRQSDPHGKAIYDLAMAVTHCTDPEDPEVRRRLGPARPLPAKLAPAGVLHLEATADPQPFLDRWFQDLVDTRHCFPRPVSSFTRDEDGDFTPEATDHLHRVFDHYKRTRILSPTRGQTTGVRATNHHLHRLFLDASGTRRDDYFAHLEPVIVLHNNYEFDIFNGDQGLIANVSNRGQSGTTKEVIFPRPDGTYRAIHLSQIRHQIEHAYATTIHKSQGSEFHHVALLLPPNPSPLLTRELLYTGITRASQSVTVLDPSAQFGAAAANPTKRHTGLAELLSPDTPPATTPQQASPDSSAKDSFIPQADSYHRLCKLLEALPHHRTKSELAMALDVTKRNVAYYLDLARWLDLATQTDRNWHLTDTGALFVANPSTRPHRFAGALQSHPICQAILKRVRDGQELRTATLMEIQNRTSLADSTAKRRAHALSQLLRTSLEICNRTE